MTQDVSSLEGRIHRLESRAAIQRLLFRYCELVDRNEQDGVVGLFTDDAVFDYGLGRVQRGTEELRVLFSNLDANEATSHHLSNLGVELSHDGRTASSTSTLYAFHRRRADGQEVHLWGRYIDDLVLTDVGWRLSHRRLRAAAEKWVPPREEGAAAYERIGRRDPGETGGVA